MFYSTKLRIENGNIVVYNFRGKYIANDIRRAFKTSRISTYMFKEVNHFSIVFPEFFALELYHILDDLIASRRGWTQVGTMREIQKLLMEETWLANTELKHASRLDFTQLKNFIYTPLDHQLSFLKTYDETLPKYNLSGMLLAAKPGSGKTYTSLAVAECLHADRIVVVCPKPAVERVWVSSTKGAECLYKKPQTAWHASSGEDYRGERIAIFHFEALEKAVSMAQTLNRGKVVVILDESHFLNEDSSLRTDRFNMLCKLLKCEDVVLQTGTPFKALSVEAVPLLRAIDPLFTEDVEMRFKKMFAGEATKTTTILSRRLNIVSFKVSKSELNLDPIEHIDVKVNIRNGNDFTLNAIGEAMVKYAQTALPKYESMADEAQYFIDGCLDIVERSFGHLRAQEREYQQSLLDNYRQNLKSIIYARRHGGLRTVLEEIKACNVYEKSVILPNLPNKETKDKFKDLRTILKYPELKVRGECLGRVLGRARIDAHVAMVSGIDFDSILQSTDKKTVVFTSYADVIVEAEAKLKKEGYKPVCVYGKFTSELPQIVSRFEKVESVNPLIATYASLSTAVPLVMADTMIVINMPFRDYILEQTIARIHRLGATSPVRVFYISLDTGEVPNISTRTTDILKWSRDQVNAILHIPDIESLNEADATEDEALVFVAEEMAIEREVLHEAIKQPQWLKW